MTMIVSLANRHGNYLEITADTSHSWLYCSWKGQLKLSEVIAGSEQLLLELKRHKFHKILNDNRDLLGHWSEANTWITEVWIPQAQVLGLKKFAHIQSHYSYGQLSAREMQQKVGESFQMQIFSDPEQATSWLSSD